jgi:hypothetical protein
MKISIQRSKDFIDQMRVSHSFIITICAACHVLCSFFAMGSVELLVAKISAVTCERIYGLSLFYLLTLESYKFAMNNWKSRHLVTSIDHKVQLWYKVSFGSPLFVTAAVSCVFLYGNVVLGDLDQVHLRLQVNEYTNNNCCLSSYFY